MILLHEPYRSAVPRQGVRIIGGWTTELLDLSNATLTHELWMHHCRFDASVDLKRLRTPNLISLIGSQFTDALSMDDLQVDGSLFMHGGGKFARVVLRSAKIGGQLNMGGSQFTGVLNMNGVQVNFTLFMHEKAKFVDVNLRGAKIGGQLNMTGSQFTGALSMDLLQVNDSLFMHERAKFANVYLRGAKIGSQLNMGGSQFTGALNMNYLQVDGSLFMHGRAKFAGVVLRSAKIGGQLDMGGSQFTGVLNMEGVQIGQYLLMRDVEVTSGSEVNLPFAEIQVNLDISKSKLPSLDLTGTKIHGVFRLGSPLLESVRWQQGSILTLSNTTVETFQDRQDSWPDELDLVGFTYARLPRDVASRGISWLKAWLQKQKEYSPQPYQHLASVLRKAGHRHKANDVLYAGKERERKQAKGRQWVWLTVLNWFIGYGFRTYYTLPWVLALIVAGALVLSVSNQGPLNGMPYGFSYSVDMLLPIIELSKRHYEIHLDGFARYYFYFHKVMGWILASFIVAGIAGLTEKA